ncbi:chromosomal replication initiator protein DnaA [Patescibacteria group bacterium]|nr:chromosomal replication initiator protein DnaA [Patescibacteria group bacterium]
MACGSEPGRRYNPLFIYGGVGLGKTHIVNAIGHAIIQRNPRARILYVSAERFTNEFIWSLQNHEINSFRKRYRTDCEVLLMDDIQFLAGREQTQEEFFHTFNALYMQAKQIILTADRKPEQMGNIKDRLISRFMGGLTVDIQLPNYEMRLAILKQKCQRDGCEVGEKELDLIASQVQSNTRELEGSLIQIIARAKTANQPITTDFISDFFGVKRKEQLTNITPKKILSEVAKTSELRIKDITGQSRKAPITKARQIAMYLMRKDLELPLIHIGKLFGDRDHTTVMHSVDKIERMFTTNQELRHEVSSLRTTLFRQ